MDSFKVLPEEFECHPSTSIHLPYLQVPPPTCTDLCLPPAVSLLLFLLPLMYTNLKHTCSTLHPAVHSSSTPWTGSERSGYLPLSRLADCQGPVELSVRACFLASAVGVPFPGIRQDPSGRGCAGCSLREYLRSSRESGSSYAGKGFCLVSSKYCSRSVETQVCSM